MDFLYAESPRSDDVIAEDFVLAEGAAWKTLRPAQTQALALAKARAGKEVAHLTYARLSVTSETKPWLFVNIAADISVAFSAFLANVPQEKLDDCWQRGIPA